MNEVFNKDTLKKLGLLLLRALPALMLLTHGFAKLQDLIGGKGSAFSDPLGMGPTFSLVCATGAEFFCSLLVIAGLFTRWAVLPIMFTMGVAVFAVHDGQILGAGELAGMYFIAMFCVLLLGPGGISLDSIFRHKE